VARVGNATGEHEYVLSADVPGGTPYSHDGRLRDADGRIRRQGARFRIYAEFEDGTCSELTAIDGLQIQWTVEIANLKAGWYAFENAMDLPAGFAKEARHRNASVQGEDRKQLDICPGPRSISGTREAGPQYRFDSGSFFGKRVNLGEIRTDEEGRLIFLGGHGLSAPRADGTRAKTFANNDDWHDDTADGPVWAKVTFPDGTQLDAEAGYVVVAPPNFAPGLFGAVTMLDVVQDMFQRAASIPTGRCSFTRHVWPLFQRMSDLQWTNHGIYMTSGVGSPLDARSPRVVERLRDASQANAAFRKTVLSLFRFPGSPTAQPGALLPHYGDFYGDFDAAPGAGLAVTPLMYGRLVEWAEGRFDDDWAGEPDLVEFASLDAAAQAEALDVAGLFECLGGPFHPGIELTWVMRLPRLWKRPFRLDVRPGVARQDFGSVLTPAECVGAGGPYDGVRAGALTRFMGVPWQTDEASCLSDLEYAPSTYLSFPSFWGARVPNRVLSIQAWERVTAGDLSPEQAMKHFSWREDWLRDLKGDYEDKINRMVTNWWELGILEKRPPGPDGASRGLGMHAWIEAGRPASVTGSNTKTTLVAAIEALDAGASALPAAGMTAAKPYVPPRRRLRRDEI
jgi:hypothetical protein